LWMMPKKLFEKCGENDRLLGTVSDDRELGVAIKNLGYEILLLPKTVKMQNENLTFSGGIKHLSKWFGMLRAEGFIVYTIILFLFNPMLISLIALGIATTTESRTILILALWGVVAAFIVRLGGIYRLNKRVYRTPASTNIIMTVFYDILLLPFLYLININNQSIVWKGKKYKIGKHGQILATEEKR